MLEEGGESGVEPCWGLKEGTLGIFKGIMGNTTLGCPVTPVKT